MTIRKRIQGLVTDCNKLKDIGFREDWRTPDDAFWAKVEALQKELDDFGVGLVPGRHLQWNVADGYAHYFVVKVNKRDVELVHLDYMDGYWFQGCWREGDKVYCPRPVAELAYQWRAGLKKLFAK